MKWKIFTLLIFELFQFFGHQIFKFVKYVEQTASKY